MLGYLFYGLFILACVVLVVTVLLQPGKADAGALFSSSVSSTAFGPRGTQTLLSKITIGAAAGFMLFALILSLPAITGTSSVLQSGIPEQAPVATPTPAATPAVPLAIPTSTTLTPSPAPKPSSQPSKAPTKK
ncbi:MAG TPA: preprotein translocase subunit SecG [Pyrinomonadaceae bacterium]|nr:preprotein translocase subunit SecG [Pyrinomonadaceae bacterium]